MSTGGWILSILAILILVALAVGVIVWLVSSSSRHRAGAQTPGASAREIRDTRLASGVLTSEQHDELAEQLLDREPTIAQDQ